MSAREVAEEHRAAQQRLAADVEAEGRRLWSGVDRDDLSGSWQQAIPRLSVALAVAQRVAAGQADSYTDSVLRELNIDAEAEGSVNPASLSGRASDGRSLLTLLTHPVVTTKLGLASGSTITRALAGGQANLSMILRTQVADAGRVADGMAITARPRVGYVRITVGKTCSRCVVLAGKFYRWNAGFQRHPSCDCRHIPSSEAVSGDLRTDPRAYFDSLTEAEQDRTFTIAGAKAIRDGADISQVVNSRRGMFTAGGRRLTREGTTRRGLASQRRRAIEPGTPEERILVGRRGAVAQASERRVTRLMPEQIYRDATSRAEAVRLLKLHGYIS